MIHRGDIYCNKSTGTEYIILETCNNDGYIVLSPVSKGLDFSEAIEMGGLGFDEWYEPQWIPKVGDIVRKKASEITYTIDSIREHDDFEFGEYESMVKLSRTNKDGHRLITYYTLAIVKKMFIKIQ